MEYVCECAVKIYLQYFAIWVSSLIQSVNQIKMILNYVKNEGYARQYPHEEEKYQSYSQLI